MLVFFWILAEAWNSSLVKHVLRDKNNMLQLDKPAKKQELHAWAGGKNMEKKQNKQ